MLGLHVVRTEDGRRPRFWHLVGRWLAGLALVPFGVLILAIALAGAAGFDAPLSVSEWLGISSVHREVPDGPAVTRAERTAADEAAAKDPQLAAHEALVREKRARKDRAGEREAVARRVREGRGGRPAYGRRLGAALLDFVLTPVAGVVLWFAVLLSAPDDRLMDDTTLFWGALGGSCLLCSYLNRVLLNRTLHGTPGRRAFGIRLAVTKTGRQPGIPRLSLQWLLGLALAPLSFFFLLFGAAPPAQSLVGLTAVPARERGGPRITAPA
ncbi:RDD family protein [Streptomyces sp. P6-2-1]|uniref:RDD family protein n=1 Tax=Streptomyces sp. P6-2-1 TaxID=3422591 RepID=UPI003D36DB5F